LGQSPDTWFYVDPCLGAGTVDKKGADFIKAFEGNYFFADKKYSTTNTIPIMKPGNWAVHQK
jgi:hypothetical protein